MPHPKHLAAQHGNDWVQTFKEPIPWIWDGMIAEDAVTLLSAPEKTGKSTLLSLLLDRRREGGQLLGRTVRQGRTILCSEEHQRIWALRQPPLDFGTQLEYHCPLSINPSRKYWRRFIDHLLELEPDSFDLLVIDTVMTFLPAAQNNPHALRWALNEIRLVAGLPAAVLLLHQANTGRGRTRTHGPLTAFADILIDMKAPPGDLCTRRRHFSGVGRYPGTFQHLAAELNPEGTDYLPLPDDPSQQSLAPILETVLLLLRESSAPLTRQEILNRWPETATPPHADSLGRSLTHGCERGMLVRSGAGNKAEAFRYDLVRQSSGSKD